MCERNDWVVEQIFVIKFSYSELLHISDVTVRRMNSVI